MQKSQIVDHLGGAVGSSPFTQNSIRMAAMIALGDTTPTMAAPIVGAVDGLNSTVVGGWACIQGADETVSIAVYAGTNLVGVFPTTVTRTDLQSECGSSSGQFGFSINLDSTNINQQLAGQQNITIYAIADGETAYLLPPSNDTTTNPFSIPNGTLSDVVVNSGTGTISGVVTSATGSSGAPTVTVYAGGPYAIDLGQATTTLSSGNTYNLSLASSAIVSDLLSAPTGYALPIYVYTEDAANQPLPLAEPISLLGLGSPTLESMTGTVSQSGTNSGITNTIFTEWLGANDDLLGYSGNVTLTGNDPSFSEELISVGFTTGNEATCESENDTSPTNIPTIYRLGGVILKNITTTAQSVPISFALPYGMPLSGAGGTCLITLISAGYPYLNTGSAKYTTATSNLTATFYPAVSGAPSATAAGIGNEFKFPSGLSTSAVTIVALKMKGATQLDEIAGSVSAGGVLGAPASSGWLPTPTGNWTATTSFYHYSVSDCAALTSAPIGLTFNSVNSYYSVGKQATPTTGYTVPTDAVRLVTMPVSSYDSTAVQQTSFHAFASASQLGTSTVALATGECLVAVHSIAMSTGSTLTGTFDFENQSTAYLHLPPM